MSARLKSLELIGYKTFANRTVFEFAERVTAIVGPNGSGKSNIADSLRWVLGEQSYSLLRGKRTEDMIFSGSEQRPRAGMAAATVTFDNSDGWLPIEFSEVAITRRAYRDGSNDYLINGQRVRLKDVSELLAQSGLAERTYTIIGQGLVDAALALRAEDRRRLFEEAAGIGLYRARREESLRRLDTTRRNIERVQDILAELEPRLRSLEKQARRAQEYEQVKSDLRLLLRDWYGYHWHRSQQEMAEAQEAAREQDIALERTRAEYAQVSDQLGGTRDRIQGLRASLNGLHRQSAQLHNRREAIGRDLAVIEERLRALASQDDSLRSELNRLEEQTGTHSEQIKAAQDEQERLLLELEDARSQSIEAGKMLNERQQQRMQAEQELRNAEQTLAQLNGRKGELQARLVNRQTQVEQRQSAVEQASIESARLEKALAQAAEFQVGANSRLASADNDWKNSIQAIEALRGQQLITESERNQAFDQLVALRADLASGRAQLEVLEQAEAAMTGYSDGTRTLLEDTDKLKQIGVIGALNQRLDVPADVEAAISAALGDFLDGALLSADPESALDLLIERGQRGALIPLSQVKRIEADEQVSDLAIAELVGEIDGLIGRANNLVIAPVELVPVIDLLLGRVLIVRDRTAARGLIEHIQSRAPDTDRLIEQSDLRIVTRNGEIYYPNGLVVNAGISSASGQTILGRQRQRRELTAWFSQYQELVETQQGRVKAFETQLEAMQSSMAELTLAEKAARQKFDQLTSETRQADLAFEQARQKLEGQQAQQHRIRDEMQELDDEIQQLTSDLVVVDQDIEAGREQRHQESSRLAGLSLDELQIQLAHWNTRMAVNERAVNDGSRRLDEQRQTLDQAVHQQALLSKRFDDIQSSIQKSNSDKLALRDDEGEIGRQIEDLAEQIEPAEVELDKLEKEQARLENGEAQARQNLSLIDHRHAQSRILLSRRQESLQALQHRIEEDFGLVAFEYAEQISGQATLPLGDMVEQLPRLLQIPPELDEAIRRQRAQLRRMGTINLEAQAEYLEVSQRYEFMVTQLSDLNEADEDIRQVIHELDSLMEREFNKTFEAVMVEFKDIFVRMFGGGSARLVLTDPDNLSETGIDIEARLPGRRTQGLSLLSGGERSLTATALVFALLKVSPTPFCLLDEVDAMLDEANVSRFRGLLSELSQRTQFVIVTHNRNTVQVADVIYGVTMGRDSASQVIGLKLDEVEKVVNG